MMLQVFPIKIHLWYVVENPAGTVTTITGESGYIESPNYPLQYPANFEHDWQVTVGDNSTIKVMVMRFLTEPTNDILKVKQSVF